MQSEISNYTCVCSERWGSSSIHVLQSAYLFILWLHKMEYSINELQYTVYCNRITIYRLLQYNSLYILLVAYSLYTYVIVYVAHTPNPQTHLLLRVHTNNEYDKAYSIL